MRGSHAHYVPTGHLVYGFTGTLRAVASTFGRLEVIGTPVPVLEGVVTTPIGVADVAVAANGSLVYVPGSDRWPGVRRPSCRWIARDVPRLCQNLPLDSYRDVRVSPDGARLALATQNDVWIYDVARATMHPADRPPGPDYEPALDARWPAHHLYL